MPVFSRAYMTHSSEWITGSGEIDLSRAESSCMDYNIRVMGWGILELEPEVEEWYFKLDDVRRAQAFMHFELLEQDGVALGTPYVRQLDGQLSELRFYCGGAQQRVSYWIAMGRRIILLTVFHKTKRREPAEVERAKRAMDRCRQEKHTADEEDER